MIQRALEAQVSHQIIVGCTPKDSMLAVEFVKLQAQKGRGNFWSTLGAHPHHANEVTPEMLNQFRVLAESEDKIVALGEIGLDYFHNLQPPEVQHQAFKLQLELARELNLPVIVHVRDAWDDALKVLQQVGNDRVILHCFTGNLDQAKICWERGYFTSFSGVLTYPKNEYLREIARVAPEEKILIETDCPYLPPQPLRGKRNEPAYVVETAKELAKARSQSLEEIGAITTQNARTIFKL